jgi:ribulose 1,5-bisphosphate synthetase/thiazole synthase
LVDGAYSGPKERAAVANSQTVEVHAREASDIEHFDVLIVGAGISGIGGGYHLQQQCPGTRFTILEAEESFGGTW